MRKETAEGQKDTRETPQDSWQKDYSKPGKFNPLTGKLNLLLMVTEFLVPILETSGSSSYYLPG